jgi:pimeloyl-ACP methyl ester carboxylesterase
MQHLIKDLIKDSLDEVRRREPTYFERFGFSIPSSYIPPTTGCHAPCGVTRTVEHAVAALADLSHTSRSMQHPAATDPVAALLLDSAFDALSAADGAIELRPAPKQKMSLSDLLAHCYTRHTASSGRAYFVRNAGTTPLLLVSALGVPLSMWSLLLGDDSHDLKIIVCESRCGDVLAGGMRSDASLTQHSEDLKQVLDEAEIEKTHVLAWCNGGRIAVDLAARWPTRVLSLTLHGTTMKGITGIPNGRSPFEDSLQQIFNNVLANPALGKPLVSMIAGFSKLPDWDSLQQDGVKRAAAFLPLPAREHSTDLLAPMSTAEGLSNYARRTAADEAHPLAESLRTIRSDRIPVMAILGEQDAVVNNDCIRFAIRAYAGDVTEVVVRGAGHYSHDLQYRYFRWALTNFVTNLHLPAAPARLLVTQPSHRT